MSLARRLFGETVFYPTLKALGHYPDYFWWMLRGKPARLPHLVKQHTVADYAARYQLRTLVEAGTYYGEMIGAMIPRFDHIYSVELNSRLAELARRRFEPYPQVKIMAGDSQQLIPELLLGLEQPCLFWMDAGYYGWGGEVGNMGRLSVELNSILTHKTQNHVVLMDDADALDGRDGRLSAAELIAEIEQRFPHRQAELKIGILRIVPR